MEKQSVPMRDGQWFGIVQEDELLNMTSDSQKMPEERRKSVLVSMENRDHVQSCNRDKGMKLMSHMRKMW